jgi:hypothetical protein
VSALKMSGKGMYLAIPAHTYLNLPSAYGRKNQTDGSLTHHLEARTPQVQHLDNGPLQRVRNLLVPIHYSVS